MVSPQNPSTADVAPVSVPSDRGFTREESVSAAAYPSAGLAAYAPPTSFWGSVIAGTLLAMSIFVLSWCLMLGCHVGVVGDTLSLGWGSAIWIAITSCIAFYFGGLMTNGTAHHGMAPAGPGWMKGAAVWALSIPLALTLWGLASSGLGMMGHFTVAQSAVNSTLAPAATGVMFGWFWTAFITLADGLIFAMLGGMSSGNKNRGVVTTSH